MMSRITKLIALTLAIILLSPLPGFSMHIMEGYLPAEWCSFWYIISLPFVVLSYRYIRRSTERHPKQKVMLALSAAFVFILSAIKLPSVTGSSSHLTGTTLGTVVVGPWAMPLIGVIVLLFQALLLAHGGISTLGANVASMTIVAPFVSYGLIRLFEKLKAPRSIGLFVATFFGVMSTYVTTSFQLALSYPGADGGVLSSAMKFLAIFAVTQVPLAIIEGVITISVLDLLLKQGMETALFQSCSQSQSSITKKNRLRDWIILSVAALFVLMIPLIGSFIDHSDSRDETTKALIKQIKPDFSFRPFFELFHPSDTGEAILLAFQILIGVCIFGYALYRLIKHNKKQDKSERKY